MIDDNKLNPAAISSQRELISYSVGVQTSEPWAPRQRSQSANGLTDSEGERSPSTARILKVRKNPGQRERRHEEELRERLRQEIEVEIELKTSKNSLAEASVSRNDGETATRLLNAEELSALVSNDEFLGFVERSTRVAERRLDQEYDVLADYALEGLSGVEEDDAHFEVSKGKKAYSIKEVAQFYDERWSKKRMISDVHFSPKVC